MVRISNLMLRQFKYWKRYMYREMYRDLKPRKMFLPIVGWKEDKVKEWNIDDDQPWTQEFHAKNKPWVKRTSKKWVQPIKDWPYYKGDVGCYPTQTRTVQHRPYSTMADVPEGILMGLGNPLLDVTVFTDETFLKKYGLIANNAILAEEKHNFMFEEMLATMNPEFVAGGATQNSIRVAQWLLQKPNATTFFGCVGNDRMGGILKKKAQEVGVNVHFQINASRRTGLCGAVITGESRSLVTRLGSAENFTYHFLEKKENWMLVEKAKYYYIGGFVFTVSPKSIKMIAEHSTKEHKTLVMNLSAPFLCHFYVDPTINIVPNIDILIGNETEAATFCKLIGIETNDIKEMAAKVSLLPKANNNKRIVIFTQGCDPTIIAKDGEVSEFPVTKLPHDRIKDTNGCGDAFVGGFMSQLVQGKNIDECVRCGKYAAVVIIQHYGCTFPDKPDFE